MRVQIPEPCTENWELMSPQDKGRHCNKCAKTVVDFTTMTDYNIVEYLKNNTNTCGRFYNFQLNKDLTPPQTTYKWKTWLGKIAASSLLFAQFITSKAKANPLIVHGGTTFMHYIDDNVPNHKRIAIAIIHNDSLNKTISQLKFKFNDFEIDTLVNGQSNLSFQLPDSIQWTELNIELKEISNDTFHFTIPYSVYSKAINLLGNTQIRFYYDSTWRYIIETHERTSNYQWDFDIPATMGMFVKPFKFDTLISHPVITQTYGFTTIIGDSISSKKDTFKFDSITHKKRKVAFKEKLKQEKRWDNLWTILFFAGIGGLVAWWVMRGKTKKEE